jgi:hypothetical protein
MAAVLLNGLTAILVYPMVSLVGRLVRQTYRFRFSRWTQVGIAGSYGLLLSLLCPFLCNRASLADHGFLQTLYQSLHLSVWFAALWFLIPLAITHLFHAFNDHKNSRF